MDSTTEAPKSVKSMDELASIMAQNRDLLRKAGSQPNEVEQDADVEDADDEIVEEETEVADNSDQDDVDEATDDKEAAETDEGSDPAVDVEEFEISDDDLIDVDGVDEPVSFKTLKEAYTADKTIASKIEQTIVAHEHAEQTYRKAETEAKLMGDAMQALVEGIDQILTQPLVSEPPASLKSTNPAQYIQHMEAYQQDQQRISSARQSVLDALKHHTDKRKELHTSRKQFEIAQLADKLPALKDPNTKRQASQDILDAAAHFGFSPEEINESADHRMFLMAHAAQQYLKLMGKSTAQKEEQKTTIKRRVSEQPRVLRTKNSKAKNANDQKVRKLKTAAKKSGSTDDIAAFMAANRASR